MPKFLNSVDIEAPSLKIESSGNAEPAIEILSTSSNAFSGILRFNKQRADDTPVDEDIIGFIEFTGEDASGGSNTYGKIQCNSEETAAGNEAGKISVIVSNDGTLGGNVINGTAYEPTAGQVNVNIANGAASTTTIAGTFTCGSRTFAEVGGTPGAHDGDVVYFGNTTGLTTGLIYVYTDAANAWVATNADHIDTSDGLLGVALGAESDTHGMLLRGVVSISHDPGAKADILYLQSDNAGDVGKATATAPSADGDCVRIIGYQIDADDEIWFNPDNTFIEVTA